MRDAIELDNAKIIYKGKEPDEMKTYLTSNKEIYIGLRIGSVWVNIHSKEIHKYIESLPGLLPMERSHKK